MYSDIAIYISLKGSFIVPWIHPNCLVFAFSIEKRCWLAKIWLGKYLPFHWSFRNSFISEGTIHIRYLICVCTFRCFTLYWKIYLCIHSIMHVCILKNFCIYVLHSNDLLWMIENLVCQVWETSAVYIYTIVYKNIFD